MKFLILESPIKKNVNTKLFTSHVRNTKTDIMLEDRVILHVVIRTLIFMRPECPRDGECAVYARASRGMRRFVFW
jgi:hypothetical protein